MNITVSERLKSRVKKERILESRDVLEALSSLLGTFLEEDLAKLRSGKALSIEEVYTNLGRQSMADSIRKLITIKESSNV